MRHTRLIVLALVLSACASAPPMPPSDATPDSAMPTPPDPDATFTLGLDDTDLVVDRGGHTTLAARVMRTGGYAEPVLVELAGLPDACMTLARESRPGDTVTTVTIVVPDDAEPITRAAFVVQATALSGLRQTYPARITIR